MVRPPVASTVIGAGQVMVGGVESSRVRLSRTSRTGRMRGRVAFHGVDARRVNSRDRNRFIPRSPWTDLSQLTPIGGVSSAFLARLILREQGGSVPGNSRVDDLVTR